MTVEEMGQPLVPWAQRLPRLPGQAAGCATRGRTRSHIPALRQPEVGLSGAVCPVGGLYLSVSVLSPTRLLPVLPLRPSRLHQQTRFGTHPLGQGHTPVPRTGSRLTRELPA